MSGASESSNSVRSLVKPALHDGKQIGGGVGWRASVGSGGRLACGVAAGGLGGCEGDAQALTSHTSSSKVSRQGLGFASGIVSLLFCHRGAAVFFGARRVNGHAGLALPVAALALKLGDRLLVVGVLVGQAHGLPAGQGSQGQDDDDQNPLDHLGASHS